MNALEIKKRRELLGITQEKLGELIGVSKNTIYNYENGKKIPESKITILQHVLYPDNTMNNILKDKKHLSSYKPELKETNEHILKNVNKLIKSLKSITNPDINDLEQLNKAANLKEKIQEELNKLNKLQ